MHQGNGVQRKPSFDGLVCARDACAGCMACMDVCPVDAIHIDAAPDAYNAHIDTEKCISCAACHRVCQANHPAPQREPIEWSQGWAEDSVVREGSSSGGAAQAVLEAFVRGGGYVCSCRFHQGSFSFHVTNDVAELPSFAGSKYVKSDPSGSYKAMKRLLAKGEKVLFLGLPCQVSSALNYMGSRLRKRFYVVDLICHGSPSPVVLKRFLADKGVTLERLSSVLFRRKDSFGCDMGGRRIAPRGAMDSYTVAFLRGLSYTRNCYSCPYAGTARVSDLTLGDSWGSSLSADERKRGISLLLCQTEKGRELIAASGLHLGEVDVEKAVENNGQLDHPSPMPPTRDRFMSLLSAGVRFDRAVATCLPVPMAKQHVKSLMVKFGVGE